MGAWDNGVFDNDDAMDWLDMLIASKGDKLLVKTYNGLEDFGMPGLAELEQEDLVDSGTVSLLLAAGTIVAALSGAQGLVLPEEAQQWIESNRFEPSGKLRVQALRGVELAIGPKSEINDPDMWGSEEDHQTWLAEGEKLRGLLA